MVAYANAMRNPWRDSTRDTAEMTRLFVRAEVRRRGIATSLVSHLEERTAQAGYRLTRLDTGGRQPGAVALFKRREIR